MSRSGEPDRDRPGVPSLATSARRARSLARSSWLVASSPSSLASEPALHGGATPALAGLDAMRLG